MKKLSSESQETIYFLTIFFTLENINLLLPSPNPCFVSQKHLGAIPSKSKICVQGFFNERQQEKNVRAKADWHLNCICNSACHEMEKEQSEKWA